MRAGTGRRKMVSGSVALGGSEPLRSPVLLCSLSLYHEDKKKKSPNSLSSVCQWEQSGQTGFGLT